MKQASVVASVILVAAVLLAAYAIGRLIRQARLDIPETPAQRVVEPNDFDDPNIANASRQADSKRKEPTPEERAKIKQERLEKLAEKSTMTEEEKEQYRNEMRLQLLARGKDREPGQVPRLSPEELAEVSERWPAMSDEEKAAFRARIRGRQRVPRPVTDQNPPSPNQTADPSASETKASEPNTPN